MFFFLGYFFLQERNVPSRDEQQANVKGEKEAKRCMEGLSTGGIQRHIREVEGVNIEIKKRANYE